MTIWRTLADAPRDGRPILLWGRARSEPGTWSWNEDESCWDAVHESRPVIESAAPGEDAVFKTADDDDFDLWAPIEVPDLSLLADGHDKIAALGGKADGSAAHLADKSGP